MAHHRNTVSKLEEVNPTMPQSFRHLTANMESELEKRKSDWESEVSKMQQDFFKMKTRPEPKNKQIMGKTKTVDVQADKNLKPRRKGTGSEIFDISHAKTLYCDQPDGTKLFKLRFDVKGYEPHEIGIKAEGDKLSVTAKCEESNSGNTAIKQFNRQVDIPRGVDPDNLVSFLSADGILSIEAPVEEFSDDEEEDEEEVENIYIDLPTVDPPQYHSVMQGAPGGGYSSSYSIGGAPGYSSVTPGAGYSYSHSHHTSNYPVVTPGGVSITYESHHHGHGPGYVGKCRHNDPRKPMDTHLKRIKEPKRKVDYIKQVVNTQNAPRGNAYYSYSGTSPGLMGSTIAGSLLSSSSALRNTSTMNHFRYNDPTIVNTDEGRRLKMVVDVGNEFSPEDIKLTLDGRKISVQAHKENTVSGRTSKREFSREFHSPEDLESYTARASLAEDGKLYVGACVKGCNDQDKVMRLVHGDMPSDAAACKLTLL